MVTLLYDDLVQHSLRRASRPGLRRRWTRGRDRAAVRVPPAPRRDLPRRLAAHRRVVRAQLLRALDPGSPPAGGPGRSFRSRARAAIAAGAATDAAGHRGPGDTDRRPHARRSRSTFSPSSSPCRSRPSCPPAPAPTSASSGSATGPWRFVCWAHDDALRFAANTGLLGARPRSDTLRVRIIPDQLTQAAEYESGRLDVVEVPFGETRAGRAARRRAAAEPALRALYIAINTTPRPARGRRGCARRSTTPWTSPRFCAIVSGGRGILRRRARSRPARGARLDPAPVSLRPRRCAQQLLADAGYPGGLSLQLWRTAAGRATRGSRRRCSTIWRRSASRWRSSSATRRARARPRATARPTSSSSTGAATIPTPRTSSSRCSTRGNIGAGRELRLLRRPALDSLILPRADHARHGAEGAALPRDRRSASSSGARGSSSGFRWICGPCGPTWRAGAPGDLQRPALDRGRARGPVSRLLAGRLLLAAPDPARRARRRVPAALRRSRAIRSRRWSASGPTGRPSPGSGPSCTSTTRCPRSSAATSAACSAATWAPPTSPGGRSSTTCSAFPRDAAARAAAMLLAARAGLAGRDLGAWRPGQLARPARDPGRLSRRLVSGVLGGAAADPALRRHAALAAALGIGRARVPRAPRASRSACARSRSSRA